MAKAIQGKVVSVKSDKTITVLVTGYKNHPLYRKRYISTKKYLVHDEKNQAKLDDTVVFGKSRPISKRKHWNLLKIVEVK